MDQPYEVLSQTPRTVLNPATNSYVPAMEIRFQTKAGDQGVITVLADDYTADKVRARVGELVDEMNAVRGLNG